MFNNGYEKYSYETFISKCLLFCFIVNIEDSAPAPKRPEPVKKVEPVRVGDIRGTNNTGKHCYKYSQVSPKVSCSHESKFLNL